MKRHKYALNPDNSENPISKMNNKFLMQDLERVYESQERTSSAMFSSKANKFTDRMDEPFLQGCTTSLRSFLVALFRIFVEEQMKVSTFENILKLLDKVFKPLSADFPTSLYLVRKVLEVPEFDAVEEHICICEGHIFQHAKKQEWNKYKNEKCPKCKEYRFKSQDKDCAVPSKV